MKKQKQMPKSIKEIQTTDYFSQEESILTGIKPLDNLLSGGLITGEMVQLVGESNVGKTTIALQIAYNYCNQGKKVLFVDTKLGISSSSINNMRLNNYINCNFYYVRASAFKELDDVIDGYIGTGEIDLLVIDSIASLVNDGYLNLNKKIEIDNNNSNYDSRPLSLLIKKLSKLGPKYQFTTLLVNEIRCTINKITGSIPKIFGPKVLGYETNVIIKMTEVKKGTSESKLEPLKETDGIVPISFEIIKSNRQSNKKISIFIKKGYGYSTIATYIYVLLEKEIIKQNGAYYSFNNSSIKGIKALYDALISNNTENINETMMQIIDDYYSYINSN